MRLLYAFSEPLPMSRARGIQTACMVEALCLTGVDVVLACPLQGNANPLQALGRDTLPPGLELLSVSRNWPFPFQRWHSVSRFARLLVQQMERVRPDIIFVRHLKLAYQLLRLCPGIPLIYEAHEVFPATAPVTKQHRLAEQEAYVLSHARGIVYISGAVRGALHRAYPNIRPKAEIVLHSGVKLPEMELQGNVEASREWVDCRRRIIYTGSFFDWKGADDLVVAAGALPSDCHVTLIGGEPAELARLAGRISEDGAQVTLMPRLPASEVMKHLLSACIAVLPNRADGVSQFTSPLKLFEYMGAGCAVVAADLPSVREVLADHQVSWFTSGDPVSLAEAIRRLLDHPDNARIQGEQLYKLAAEQYTWQARARTLLEFVLPLSSGGAVGSDFKSLEKT
ncbi:MAG: glycosyltransferase family 4 protein [Azovibrio sp.]